MTPVSLTIQAFGPYRKVEKIDFTKFYNSKLFLITGNTGSGKTMIFDAICYALFGESSGKDRQTDSFKSQFSDKSTVTYVEFEFKHKDKKYIVTREPEQVKISRGKEVNHRQTAKLIFDDNVITGIKNVGQEIEKILGIDYSQFKQIVMIAQGQFRELVSADSKKRESIYRTIFNTMNFENIQNILKEEASKLEKEVSFLNEKIKGLLDSIQYILPISSEENSIDQILKILNYEIKNYNLELEKHNSNKEAYKKEFEIYKDLFNKSVEKFNLNKQFKEIDIPKLQKEKLYLENSEKAFMIIGDENILNDSKNKYLEALNDKKTLDNDLNSIKNKLSCYENDSENQYVYKLEIQDINKKIIELENLKDVLDEKIKLEESILNKKNSLELFNLKLSDISKEIESLENQKDEILKFKDKNKDVVLIISENKDKVIYLESLKNCLIKYQKELVFYNEDFLKYKNIEPEYNKILNLYNQKAEELRESEEIYLRNQAGILARNLVDNSPCMVCGSKVHPRKAELFNDFISQDFIKGLKNEFDKLEEQRNEINNEAISLKNNTSIRKKFLGEIFDELLSIDKKREFIIFSIFENDEKLLSELNSIINDLKKQIEVNEEINKRILDDSKRIPEIEENLKGSQSKKKEIDKGISELDADIKATNIILKEKNEKLLKFNVHNKDDYTNILNNFGIKHDELKQKMDIMERNIRECTDEINRLSGKVDSKNEEIKKLHKSLMESEDKFLKSIKENNFSSVEEYSSFKLNQDEFKIRRKNLEDKRDQYKSLRTRILELDSKIKDAGFSEENDIKVKLKDLDIKINEIELLEKENSKRVSLLENTKKNISNFNNDILKFDEYKTNLNELNKISNGNNRYKISFERYILGIYFKEIIAAANIRFSKLTNGRFLFKHSRENYDSRVQQGLDITVFDNYTSDERQINTLSGGQSFEAALSLALGLSDVVQRYSGGIHINTLFIDEGFGSLDSDSIQNALECLVECLVDENDKKDKSKLIGIISHVRELKDFIKSKIEVSSTEKGSKIKIEV